MACGGSCDVLDLSFRVDQDLLYWTGYFSANENRNAWQLKNFNLHFVTACTFLCLSFL